MQSTAAVLVWSRKAAASELVVAVDEAPACILLFTDVSLEAADKSRVSAHRGVLAAHSSVFRDLIAQFPNETVLPLTSKTGDDLAMLVNALYPPSTGRWVKFTDGTIFRLLELAREYNMRAVMAEAEEWMIKNIDAFCKAPVVVRATYATYAGHSRLASQLSPAGCDDGQARTALQTLVAAREYELNNLYAACLSRFKDTSLAHLRVFLRHGGAGRLVEFPQGGSLMYDLMEACRSES